MCQAVFGVTFEGNGGVHAMLTSHAVAEQGLGAQGWSFCCYEVLVLLRSPEPLFTTLATCTAPDLPVAVYIQVSTVGLLLRPSLRPCSLVEVS